MTDSRAAHAHPPAYSVDIQGVSQHFMQGDTRIDVLKNIDLKVRYGEAVAILGPSGSGKSTLLNILGLLSTPASGSYLLDGTDTATFTAAQRAEARLDNIGFVFQAFHLIEHKNVYRNVELPLIYRGVPKTERAQRVADTLALLGLSHRTDAPITTLSGGEKQRVAIARALIGEPALLLCDEPTGSLDEELTREVIDLLRECTGNQQSTIVITHDPLVAEHCDRVLRMHEGQLIEQDAPQQEETTARASLNQPSFTEEQASKPQGSGRRAPWALASLKEAWDATVHRVRRNIFTMLGVVLGIASLVLTVGLTATISGQLADSFDIFRAKHLTISSTRTEAMSRTELLSLAASENYRRVSQLNGVTGTALVDQLDESTDIQRGPDNFGERGANVTASVLAATPSIFSVQGHELVWGRTFDGGHVERNDKVVVLSESVMRQLALPYSPGVTVYIHDEPYTVIGVVRENPSLTLSYGSVYLPLGAKPGADAEEAQPAAGGGAAAAQTGKRSTQIVVSTVAGAANQIAEEAPYALSPERPTLYSVSVPPEPKTLREAVDQQQRTMLLAMSVITLVIGAMGIMNTFLVAVMERRREVGLRLAIGMRPSGILLQFSAEALLTGILGAVAGIVLAVNGISIVSLMNRWTPIISADTILLGLGAGALVGVLAGLYPAAKASRIDPAQTLAAG
ncbi:ATP-binding cassette domain-containing protein [uncultured Rothia sp.]|uniref:ABC transporter ATP-binding protein/permease n=1 Tax=uncultured Rothia sp. TaxID=316088 RepID=UPI0025CD03BF|nr:ATP-binding cassette domain-containing protein [uncultured Rothia sp.]